MSGSTDIIAFEGEAFDLCPGDTAFLRTLLKGHVELSPQGIVIRRMAGHAILPSGQTLRLRSRKSSARAILTWLAYVDPTLSALRRLRMSAQLGDYGELAALTSSLFVTELLRVSGAHGLARSYQQRSRTSTVVHGRIDFARESRAAVDRAVIACRVWERTPETPVNRWLSAATNIIACDPVMREACVAELPRIQALLNNVPPLTRAERAGAPPLVPRSFSHFEAVLALGVLLVKGANLTEGDVTTGASFFVNLEWLFEKTVVRAFQQAGVDCVPKFPAEYVENRPSGAIRRTMQLDLFCRIGSGLVVDAKYKTMVSAVNLQQAIAYCLVTGASRAVLVLPGRGEDDMAEAQSDISSYMFRAPNGVHYDIDVARLRTDATQIDDWRQFGRELVSGVLGNRSSSATR